MTGEERTAKLRHAIHHLNAEDGDQKGILIRAAVAAADAETYALLIDPKLIARAARVRIADMNYPTPERERAAANLVGSYSRKIDELIRNGADLNLIRREVGEMHEACRLLTIPEKLPSPEEELHRMHDVLRQKSWTAEEIGALGQLWGSGGRISAASITSVKLGDREILRSDVRKRLKGFVTNARFNEIEKQEAEALQLEKENDLRRQRGEGAHHRHW